MSNTRERKAEEALQEYLKAVDNHNRLVDKYIPIRPVIPGVRTTGEPVTEAVFRELEESKTKIDETWERFISLLRASRS